MRSFVLLTCGFVILVAIQIWKSEWRRDYEKVAAEYKVLALREFGLHDVEHLADQAIRYRLTLPTGKAAQIWCDQGNVSPVYPEPRLELQHGTELIVHVVNDKGNFSLYVESFCYRHDPGFPLVTLDRRSIRLLDRREIKLVMPALTDNEKSGNAKEEKNKKYEIAKLSSGEPIFLYFELR